MNFVVLVQYSTCLAEMHIRPIGNHHKPNLDKSPPHIAASIHESYSDRYSLGKLVLPDGSAKHAVCWVVAILMTAADAEWVLRSGLHAGGSPRTTYCQFYSDYVSVSVWRCHWSITRLVIDCAEVFVCGRNVYHIPS